MRCDVCGQEGVRIRQMTRTYGKGKDMLIIENIPVFCCPHCHENYLSAETLHEIEQIKQNRRTLAQQRAVEVASFAESVLS
jgi:YgiT-type zinc finger domain-containing protein